MRSIIFNFKSSLLVLFLFTACNNFLDVVPKGEVIPETVADYDLLFNSANLTDIVPDVLEYMTDDPYISSGTDIITAQANAYYWRTQLDSDINLAPAVWLEAYNAIYYANIIVNKIMDAEGGTLEEKQSLLAQAKTIRALSYFHLLTVFSKAYKPGINSDALGVPIVSSINVTAKVPERATLKENFELITSDLKESLNHLPERQNNKWRVTKSATAGVLARVYLYMNEYELANEYAAIALQGGTENKILDYNTIEASDDFPNIAQNSEKIWIDYSYNPTRDQIYSANLRSYFQDEDLRIQLFTLLNTSDNTYRIAHFFNAGVSFPEMYLTQAEYLVRSNQIDAALEIVNMIRAHRFPSDYPEISLDTNDPDEALEIVLEERRRELAFSGTRWMDMKRLDAENRMPAISRHVNNDPNAEVTATLEPGSDHYTFEIPMKVLGINPDIKPNY